jgi:RNA polymerase sigma-70 factor (sigma-E family)
MTVSLGRGSKLEELYALHATSAGRLAYLLTGDKHLAEDLVQEAFIKVAGRFGHLRDQDSFGPYLKQTLVNLARGHWRRAGVERAYLKGAEGRTETAANLPDLDTRSTLMRALSTLPARQRTAVVLRHYEDLSERQTAELMECSIGNVKSLTSKGLGQLRARLAEETV